MTQPTHIEEKLREEFVREIRVCNFAGEPIKTPNFAIYVPHDTDKIADWWLEKLRTTLTQLVERDIEWAEREIDRMVTIESENMADVYIGRMSVLTDFINYKKEKI